MTDQESITSNSTISLEDGFVPVAKIGSTISSSDKDLGKSSISILQSLKNGFNYKIQLGYKTYRNISANKIQEYKALQYFQEYPITKTFLYIPVWINWEPMAKP